ncbi:MAG: DUF3341 domain-containing protein [Polyangiaceae bacterium]|jgi:hypothetical protein|nr:DUF3341 domain-containing protein [Polyangiaceae bacterium]
MANTPNNAGKRGSEHARVEPVARDVPRAEPLGEASSDREHGARPAKGAGKTTGVLALFDHPDAVLEAAEKTRALGYDRWDVFTPFPVHGMDEAMGLGKSKVPWITFLMGLSGTCAALVIQFGTMVFSWPMNYGGKPAAAWPSFIPITFEMTVFAAGVSTAIGALLLGGVLKFRKPKLDRRLTSHRFGIFVEARDPKYNEAAALSHFEKLGAVQVRVVKEGE